MKHDLISRRAWMLGLAAASALVLLGALPTSASAQTMQKIRVERSPVGQFQGLYIAQDLGYFKERGLEIEINIGGTPDGALAQLMSNQKEVAMTGAVPLVAAVANGLPVTAVVNAQDQNQVASFGLIVKADSPIKTIEDLKGKKVGVPGIASPQGSALLKTLEKHGLSRTDVELVNLPFPGVLQAIEAGVVDAGLPIGLFYDLSLQKGNRELKEVFNNATQGFPAVIFASNKQWADANKDVLTKFIEAMTLAYKYANANLDKVRAVDMAQTQLPPDYLKVRQISPFIAGFDEKAWDSENDYLLKYGFISRKPKTSEYIWSGAPRQ